jgi:nucleolar complex protein 2
MGRGATKATKKYAASGQLKKSIQARHKHQQIQKKIQGRKGKQKHKGQGRSLVTEGGEAGNDDDDETSKAATKPRVVVMVCCSWFCLTF